MTMRIAANQVNRWKSCCSFPSGTLKQHPHPFFRWHCNFSPFSISRVFMASSTRITHCTFLVLYSHRHTHTKRPHWITFENRTRGVRRHDHRFIWRPSSLSFPLLRNDVNRFWWLHFVALHFFLVFRFGRQINHSVVSRFPLSTTCTQPIKTFWKKKAAKWKALRTTQYEFGSKWNETTIHRKKFLLLLLSITHTFAEGTMWFEDDNRLSFFQCKGKQ